MGFFSSPEYRSVNRAISNVEGLKLKITAHKTFKNKFDQIRVGIKFIYHQSTPVIGYSAFRQTNIDHQLEHVLFFMLQCKRMYFQSGKLTNIFYFGARFIHSLEQPIATKHPRALICVYNQIGCTQLGNYLFSDSKVSGTIALKTGSLHVHVFGLWPICLINFSRDQLSDKLINFFDLQLNIRNY